MRPITNFFQENDSLSYSAEKELVDRLYKYDTYKEREAMKQQLEEERKRQELE
jgi:hypothetical protein